MILVDTSVWVEIFKDTKKGQIALEKLKQSETIYLSNISIAEIVAWSERNSIDSEELLVGISQTANYLELDNQILKEAGLRYNKIRSLNQKIGLIDVIIYTAAQMHGLKLISCDNDFENLPNVEIVK